MDKIIKEERTEGLGELIRTHLRMTCPDCGENMVLMDEQPEPPQSYVCDKCNRVDYI